jgi:predicted amidohydrolase
LTQLRVTLVQQPLAWHDPGTNRGRFAALLAPLAGGTDLVVLPETFTTGFSMDVERLGEPAGGPTTAWLEDLAGELDAAITGSVITLEDGRYYNRLLWAQPGGTPPRHYDKRHLFRMGREHRHFTAGGGAWTVRGAASTSVRWCATTCAFLCSAAAAPRSTTSCWCTSPTGLLRAPTPGDSC